MYAMTNFAVVLCSLALWQSVALFYQNQGCARLGFVDLHQNYLRRWQVAYRGICTKELCFCIADSVDRLLQRLSTLFFQRQTYLTSSATTSFQVSFIGLFSHLQVSFISLFSQVHTCRGWRQVTRKSHRFVLSCLFCKSLFNSIGLFY